LVTEKSQPLCKVGLRSTRLCGVFQRGAM
jgi:hypothetical protein